MSIELLLKRRSIREYLPNQVSDEDLDQILHAAMSAPSAGDAQPWQFIVIRNTATLTKLQNIQPHAEMITKAPLAILICGDLSQEKFPGYWIQDCSACIENLLLAVCAKNLGAVWIGIYPQEEPVTKYRALFSLPAQIVPLALVPIGHPAEFKGPGHELKREKIHYEIWRE